MSSTTTTTKITTTTTTKTTTVPLPSIPVSQSTPCVCIICAEVKEPGDMILIQNCSHSFCFTCLTKHVAIKVQEKARQILCPSGDGVVLEFCDIGARLPKKVAESWDDLVCEFVIPESELYYCPFKDCPAVMDKEYTEKEVTESECPECHRLFCARCRVGWHAEMGCEEFEKLNEYERREDLLLRELAQSKGWMRCPQCKFYVEKTEGCLHMTCRCKSQFCYACGATWSNTHGGCRP